MLYGRQFTMYKSDQSKNMAKSNTFKYRVTKYNKNIIVCLENQKILRLINEYLKK